MKHLWLTIVAAAVVVLPLHAENQKDLEKASSVMTVITSAIKEGKSAALKSHFEKKVMVIENENYARMFKAGTDYDRFSKNTGALHAVFFDTMRMRAAFRPFVNTDELYCLRDVLSRGKVAQMVVNPEDGSYRVAAVYRDRAYCIHLRKNGEQYKIIMITFSQREKK